MSLRRQRLVGAAALLIVLAASSSGATPTRLTQQTSKIDMERCLLSVYIFPDSAERLRKYVPEGYEVADGAGGEASFSFWVYSCADVVIDGVGAGPAILSLVGIQIADPTGGGPGTFEGATVWQLYVPWVHSDNAALVALLRSGGMRAARVKDMSYERLGPLSASASVPWKPSPYELTQPSNVLQEPFHGHDNSFWHDHGKLGTAELQIEIEFPFARDSACYGELNRVLDCASVSAREGTAIGKLVGEARIGDAINHDEIPRVEATLRTTAP